MGLINAAKNIVIKITADDSQYQAALKKADSSTADFARGMGTYGKMISAALLTATAAAVGFAVSSAAEYEALERGFSSMVKSQGKDADTYIGKLKEATKNTVSEIDIMKQANRAMLLGIDVDTLVGMAEGATVIAQATGQSTGYLFESLALGVGRQSRLLLDNLGIIVDTEKAYEQYAGSLGKTASQLTEAEQKTAFLNATMEGLSTRVDSLGGYTVDVNSNVAVLKATLSDMAVDIGSEFIPAINNALTAVNDWGAAGGWERISTELQNVAKGFVDLADVGVSSGKKLIKSAEEIEEAYMRFDIAVVEKVAGLLQALGMEGLAEYERNYYSPSEKYSYSQSAAAEKTIGESMDKLANMFKNIQENGSGTAAMKETAANTAEMSTKLDNISWANAGKRIGEINSNLTSLGSSSSRVDVPSNATYNIQTGKITYNANTSGV